MTCELAQLDGAYVLGALAPEERLAFERHLPGCESCSASVRNLAGLPGLLAQVSPDVVMSPPGPEDVPDTLLPGLVAEVRRTQRRRHWLGGLVAAAAVVAFGIATALAVSGGDEPPEPVQVAAAKEMVPVHQDSMEASVALTSVAWGTRLDLTCSYEAPDTGYPYDPPTYVLVIRTEDGETERVASWKGLPGKTMHLTGATALTTDRIAAVEVQDSTGRPLLELGT